MRESSRKFLAQLLTDPDMRQEALKVGGGQVLQSMDRWAQSIRSRLEKSDPADDRPISRGLVTAALSFEFDPETIGLSARETGWVAANAALVPGGRTKQLQLHEVERRRILDHPAASEDIHEVLGRIEQEDARILHDPDPDRQALKNAYLRGLLRGNVQTDPGRLGIVKLRALTLARAALEGVSMLAKNAPSLQECRRQMALSELLDPLSIMIGLDQGQPGGQNDRFVGRDKEMTTLRAFVDVLGSESLSEALTRGTDRILSYASDSLTGRKPRLITIEAPGGLGKSTLVAKFVYDHARSEETRFPFAFLDFDRASLQPRSPEQLLVEMARQVGILFPDFEELTQSLRRDIRAALASKAISPSHTYYTRFRDIVSMVLDACGASTFLLTLDTMEIVQADPAAMNGVTTLLQGMTDTGFPELCVAAAGRSGLDELIFARGLDFERKQLELKAFAVRDAREMVSRLGNKLLGSDWNDAWTTKLAGKSTSPEIRREPLTLRLAVEIVRDTEPENRPALIKDIEAMGERADDGFVGALYERRILDHIRDTDAQKLAWPGLVARTVSRDLVRNLLAGLCRLSPENALQAFETLSHEGWIVENEDGLLRHRRDLRARTLPMMRRHDQARFDRVVDALVDYFGSRSSFDAVEEAYYRLLRGRPEDIDWLQDRDWVLDQLADARSDMETGTPGWSLLEARFAERPMALEQMKKLPPTLLWQHLDRAGTSLISLDDRQIEPRVLLALQTGRQPSGPHGAHQFLQVKGGFWNCLEFDRLILPSGPTEDFLFAFLAARLTEAGRTPANWWEDFYPQLIERIAEARGRKNWQALSMALVVARQYDPKLAHMIDDQLCESQLSRTTSSRSVEIALRTLVVHGVKCRPQALATWCLLESSRVLKGMSLAEFAVIAPVFEKFIRSRSRSSQPDSRTRRLLELTRSSELPRNGKFTITDRDTLALLSNTFKTYAQEAGDNPDMAETFSTYVGLRQPEWIVPFAYLLADGLSGTWQDRVQRRLDGDHYNLEAQNSWTQGLFKRKAKAPRDVVGFLTWADNASDLGGAIERLLMDYKPHDGGACMRALLEIRGSVQQDTQSAAPA
ncbi:hypothetical protein [Roseibium aggregatum]|uniref:AAA ATPase-like protein n=1 Tax=Roseibium aggregatum TaxID=187304 RepID=A0A939EF97_9HYPH|nr:hypothetical protein [Roseibium aggregatum]MBN9672166.1 hypothetical protein [Roseibium aggregatum]